MRFILKVVDWLRTGSESPKNSKNYMERKPNEELVGSGLTLVLAKGDPFQNVTILGRRYAPDQGLFYNRVEVSGISNPRERSAEGKICFPTIDYRHGGLEEVFSYFFSGEKRPANQKEIKEIRKRIRGFSKQGQQRTNRLFNLFSKQNPSDVAYSEVFKKRLFLLKDYLPILNGENPLSVEKKLTEPMTAYPHSWLGGMNGGYICRYCDEDDGFRLNNKGPQKGEFVFRTNRDLASVFVVQYSNLETGRIKVGTTNYHAQYNETLKQHLKNNKGFPPHDARISLVEGGKDDK